MLIVIHFLCKLNQYVSDLRLAVYLLCIEMSCVICYSLKKMLLLLILDTNELHFLLRLVAVCLYTILKSIS